MSEKSFKDGVRHAREGIEPSPPTFNPLIDPLFCATKDMVEKNADDYIKGYEVGTAQRGADKDKQ